MSEFNISSTEEIKLNKEESLQVKNTAVIQLPEHILNNTLTMQVIKEVEHYYKEGTTAYLEGIQGYNIEMGKVKNRISILEKDKEEEEGLLLEIQAKLSYEIQLLQRLNNDFSQQIKSIVELQNEYKQMLDAEAYNNLSKHKEKVLTSLLEEIKELEMTLLNEELERLNLLAKLVPKRESIVEHQVIFRELELEKEHFESTKIHQISQLGFMDNKKESIVKDYVVDAIVVEEDDLK